ncbi:50S ribosomal protein L6 [Microbulbifer harenosus]|uniref:Large ribosomal subunit protein uL6 n=1 Tax=Microbulbifer harenosus TaxID=2576840 RepID=A0ABY2UEH2_9GAMM|nr:MULTISPECIES: 50S ribosomal protein L6 [Microbulbifer]QIL91473.1 50S ribosomal protein L6 [Microbulbifer sp. SH-1]TLM74868.1 50S ribosomal protein L6 [Microbulbifer harenosus]
MSRVANSPVSIPAGVSVSLSGQDIAVKGGNGNLNFSVHSDVEVKQEDNQLTFAARNGSKQARALAGTTRALVSNMVVGVSQGFEKKLQLVGVGYRAKAAGKSVNLSLGFSHPVDYDLPEGVSAETPSQTEIVLKSSDKQLLGQVAAEIRAFRPPEPYKGKGVRYADERVYRKEAKKK